MVTATYLTHTHTHTHTHTQKANFIILPKHKASADSNQVSLKKQNKNKETAWPPGFKLWVNRVSGSAMFKTIGPVHFPKKNRPHWQIPVDTVTLNLRPQFTKLHSNNQLQCSRNQSKYSHTNFTWQLSFSTISREGRHFAFQLWPTFTCDVVSPRTPD